MNAEDKIIAIADVRNFESSGKTAHSFNGSPIGHTVELRIVQLGCGPSFYLIHYDEDGREIADTCHSSREEAELQAEFEFLPHKITWFGEDKTHPLQI